MKIYKLNEKSKGICESCKKLVHTTFKLVSVPFLNKRGSVNDILCAICDDCDHVVSIPQQSAPRIKEAMNSKKHAIEVRLPHHLLDVLLVASDEFKLGNPELLKDTLIRYYISIAVEDKKVLANIKNFSSSDFAKGSGSRLSLKVSDTIYARFEHLIQTTSLNKTQLLKGLIL
ncbi:MAG: hypothetical protein KDK51_03005, partial [Deltaproteobacteria bacterium]|nr:hypothetical protein [Deltaproteobacteria bacterium]